MPLYEFVCVPCGKRFEKLQKNQDEEAPVCPACGSKEVKKEISSFSSSGGASPQCAPLG